MDEYLCKHWKVSGPGHIQGVSRAEPWDCPWCQIERLRRGIHRCVEECSLEEIRGELKQLLSNVPASSAGEKHGD